MILKAKARGDAVALGRYLLNASRNEQVEVGRVEGFAADNVLDAMREIEAVACGVRSKQYLFSLSLNPPARATAAIEIYDDAISRILDKTGLKNQPYITVYHENGGRRHCHLVVSRIDAETMTVKPLSHYKFKLKAVSKSLYLDNGWELPDGHVTGKQPNRDTFTHAEWQQAKRDGLDRNKIKELTRECWSLSKDRAAFAKALEERGLYLSKGDTRDYVVMSHERKSVYSLARLIEGKAADVRERLGPLDNFRTIEETRQHIGNSLTPMLRRLLDEAGQEKMRELAALDRQRMALAAEHRAQRDRLDAGQQRRQESEARGRANRLRHGLGGVLDFVSGKAKATIEANQREAFQALLRDRAQRQQLVDDQLADSRKLAQETEQRRERQFERLLDIHRDYMRQRSPVPATPQPQRQPEQAQRETTRFRADWLKAQERPERETPTPQPAAGMTRDERVQWLKDQMRGAATPGQTNQPELEPDQDFGPELER